MPLLLLLLVGIAEIAVIIVVGGWIGVLPTILLLLAGSLLGGYLLRREGARAMRALREAGATGRAPHREIADGILIFLGGLLMLLPGFLTDLAGLVCLLPPTRALVRRGLLAAVIRRFPVGLLNRPGRRYPGGPTVIEGEIDPRDNPPGHSEGP